jgi:phospholipid transport system substrate-binding protein
MTFSAERRAVLGAMSCAALALAAPSATRAQAAADLGPDALVRTLSNEVLDAIKADKSLQGGDLAKLNRLVDDKVLPYVNFEKMTQLAVGRG